MTRGLVRSCLIAGAATILIGGSAVAEEGTRTPGIDMMTKARQIYIFTLEPDTSASAVRQFSQRAVRVGGGQPRFIFDTYVKGFSIQVSDAGLARIQEEIPELGTFERASIYSIAQGKPDNPGGGGGGGKPGNGGGDESGGQITPWGIARTLGTTDGNLNVQDCGPNGASCRPIWILDTGVDQDHPDLNIDTARSAEYIDAFGPRGKNTVEDENGHGTHVAGTAAAIDNSSGVVGVAAGALVVSVRVLDKLGFGYNDEVLMGLQHVATHGDCGAGDVVNMSLGDDIGAVGASAIDTMVRGMAADGCLFALAAGNDGRNADLVSPANVDHVNVFTVSAIDSGGGLASFSNYGNPPVDVAAPGVGVVSLKRNKGTESKDGTSMAAPHVAGLLALGGVDAVKCEGTVSGDQGLGPADGIVKFGGGACGSLTLTD